MKLSFTCILRGMALSALTNAVMPVAEAWAAEEVQVLRKAAPTAEGARMMPFTTFQQEEFALTNSVPCKWISKDGRFGPSYGGGRYDFLCKGGDFATVSLYMNKAGTSGDGVGKVILLYRDWPVNANPNAGEALVAQQFLQHVVGRFVPAAIAGTVMDGFWANSSKSWSQGGVGITFVVEKQRDQVFSVRRLEIIGTGGGTGNGLNVQAVTLTPVVNPTDTGLTVAKPLQKATPQPAGTQVIIYGADGKTPLVKENVIPGVVPTPIMQPPAVTTNTGLTKELPEPAVVLPVAPAVLPAPKETGVEKPVNVLAVPQNAPAGPENALPLATPAELNTAPAPESKVKPVAPPELSATLVPATQDLMNGTGRAPSNFDIYNKAVELTKSEEKKAQIAKVDAAKVTASKPTSATTIVTPSTVVVPPLKAIPTPGKESPALPAAATPSAPNGEGLGVAVPAVDQLGQPLNYNGPRSSEVRPLPQLKFVPKAEPLKNSDEVIQFEDEKSKL